jgi:hypothetical protein
MLGNLEVEQGRVLYLAGENYVDIQMRWIAMAQQMDFDPATIPVYFRRGRFKLSEKMDQLRHEVDQRGGVDLVIVDGSTAFFEGDDENSNAQASTQHFNRELFDDALPDVFITYQRCAHSRGYFSPDRFSARAGKFGRHELTLNPDGFVDRTDEQICSTLAHEMAHVWQQAHGSPGAGRYHNKEWAAKMKSIGLMPSSTGMVGGKQTGYRARRAIQSAKFHRLEFLLSDKTLIDSSIDVVFCASLVFRGSTMDGSASGVAAGHNPRSGRFINGHSEYRARKDRLAERVRQLTLDYDPSPSQQMLLPIIAGHLDDAERARPAERRVRAGNAANRLLRLIPRRQQQEEQLMSARAMLDRLERGDL